MIVYEYPFNERIRTLLRLEDLFEKFNFFLQHEHSLQHHAAITALFEMIEVASRADLKSDLLQELERQRQTLLGYRNNPQVASDALDHVLHEVDHTMQLLSATQGKCGQHLRDNEWLMSLRGRTIIPGGACEFDLPAYYAWQKRPAPTRKDDIQHWFAPMLPLFNAILLVLRLLRDSGHDATILAQAGNYQQMLQGKTYQMLRLSLDPLALLNTQTTDDHAQRERGQTQHEIVPEISANKYMLWVRFMCQNPSLQLSPLEQDLRFTLTLCNF